MYCCALLIPILLNMLEVRNIAERIVSMKDTII